MHRPARHDRRVSELSLSSLLSPQPPLVSLEEAVDVACTDVAWELAAVDERLQVLKQRGVPSSSSSPPSSLASRIGAPDVDTALQNQQQFQQNQQAGQVADEVESALSACERLLVRAKAKAKASSGATLLAVPYFGLNKPFRTGYGIPH